MATNPFDQQRPIDGIQKIIAVASGKGGVGKSTVSANLAVSLSKSGKKVGLLDADIYGPSIPRMFGLLNQKPQVTKDQKILPITQFGIKIMSMGFLVDESAAVVWRGPMLFKALEQFFRDVEWGELDYLIIDLPPGTGDVQLSIVQKVPLAGVITVTTPQNVALSDVKKSVDMFKRVGVPLLGMVTNMAYFSTPTGEKLEMFPKGELRAYLDREKIEDLGEVGFDSNLAKAAEVGLPLTQTHADDPQVRIFRDLATWLNEKLIGRDS